MKQKKIKLLLLLLLIPVLMYFWPTQIYGNTSYIMLIGHSMHPTIEHGTFIIAKPDQQYFLGDIVAFVDQDNQNVVHRIVEQTDDGIITKGDNNPKNDPGVTSLDFVLGRVLFVIPYVGFTSLFFQTSIGAAIFGIFLLVMVANVKSKKSNVSKYNSTIVFKVAFIANVVNYVLILGILTLNHNLSKIINIPFSNYFVPSVSNTLFFCMVSIVIFVLYIIDRSLNNKKTESTKYLKLIFSLGCIMILLLQSINIINTLPTFIKLITA